MRATGAVYERLGFLEIAFTCPVRDFLSRPTATWTSAGRVEYAVNGFTVHSCGNQCIHSFFLRSRGSVACNVRLRGVVIVISLLSSLDLFLRSDNFLGSIKSLLSWSSGSFPEI
jgi:hypothetical protein